LGKNAFMPGRLRHTNEILVLLGDNTFAERSASQAAGIAGRRAIYLDEKIAASERELSCLERRHERAHGLHLQAEERAGENLVDIREPYESEEEEAPASAAAQVVHAAQAALAAQPQPPHLGLVGSAAGSAAVSVSKAEVVAEEEAPQRPPSKFKAARMRAREGS